MVGAALEGLDDETMSRQPADHSNSIAWILWHMNHVVDTFINTRLQSKTDLWIRDGWHARFELDAGARIMGYSSEELASWRAPSQDVQKQYYEAVKSAAREYIASLTNEDLDRTVTFPPGSPDARPQRGHGTGAVGMGITWPTTGRSPTCAGCNAGTGWHR